MTMATQPEMDEATQNSGPYADEPQPPASPWVLVQNQELPLQQEQQHLRRMNATEEFKTEPEQQQPQQQQQQPQQEQPQRQQQQQQARPPRWDNRDFKPVDAVVWHYLGVPPKKDLPPDQEYHRLSVRIVENYAEVQFQIRPKKQQPGQTEQLQPQLQPQPQPQQQQQQQQELQQQQLLTQQKALEKQQEAIEQLAAQLKRVCQQQADNTAAANGAAAAAGTTSVSGESRSRSRSRSSNGSRRQK